MSFISNKLFPKSPSEWFLILANLCVLILALIYQWELFDIVLAFWIENIIIGIFNTPKILMCKLQHPGHRPDNIISKIVLIIFFWFHYTIFALVHISLIVLLFGESIYIGSPSEIFLETWNVFFVIGLVGLFISHFFSFYFNFIKKKEYEKHSPFQMMLKPYIRVFIIHAFLFLGGYAILLFDNGKVLLLIIFILIKTILDLSVHKKIHA